MDPNLYAAHREHDQNHWWFRGRRVIVADLMRKFIFIPKEGASVLDIGSGPGGMIPLLKNYGEVTAVEPDMEMVKFLQKRFPEKVQVIGSSLENLNFPSDQKFSLISMFDVLEHLKDDLSMLQSCYAMLKQEGYLVCTVPMFSFLWSRHDEESHHCRRYGRQDLVSKMQAAGFKIEYLTYFNFWLFPIIAVVRLFDHFFSSKVNKVSDLHRGGYFNNLLYYIFASEKLLIRLFGKLPWGVSVLCIAKK